MGSISDFLENELLDHVFNAAYTPPGTIYVGYSTADPLDDASGLAEPSGNGYARVAITFGAAASRAITQNALVTFAAATGSWGTIAYYALFDAVSGGNMLAHGSLSVTKAIVSGNKPTIPNGDVVITVSAGEVSDYLANKWLDFVFRNQAFIKPDTYLALATANILGTDTGSTITEVSGNSYARKQVNINGGSSPTWDLAVSSVVDNTHDIDFVTPTGSWGVITALGITDALTLGNLLLFENTITEQTPTTGDPVRFPAGDLDISLS
jgi:hypothetical protein